MSGSICDHPHPGDAGCQAMANTANLNLLTPQTAHAAPDSHSWSLSGEGGKDVGGDCAGGAGVLSGDEVQENPVIRLSLTRYSPLLSLTAAGSVFSGRAHAGGVLQPSTHGAVGGGPAERARLQRRAPAGGVGDDARPNPPRR
jgi:hypothetical protein